MDLPVLNVRLIVKEVLLSKLILGIIFVILGDSIMKDIDLKEDINIIVILIRNLQFE